ncbi:hypothetical protein, partial [Vibrio cholerae]
IAGRGDKGFLPNAAGTGDTAVSFVGNSTWWFRESYVTTYKGREVNVDEEVRGVGLYDNNHRVYSPINKPTAADISALDSTD